MKKIIELTKRFGVTVLAFGLPLLAVAQSPAQFNGGGTPVPTTGINSVQTVLDFMCVIFGWMFYFLVAFAVVFAVIGAYRYLTSSGDPEKVKGANSTLMYAAIAIAVALLARSIPLIVGDFLGAGGGGSTGVLQTC